MNSTRRLLALVTAILANILWFAPYLGFGKDLTGAFAYAYIIVIIVLEIASYVLAGKGVFRVARGIFKFSLNVFIIPFNIISLLFGCQMILSVYLALPILPVAVAVLKRR